VFAFPTLIEGFGYPLLEAMACGACCVTTGESAMREVGGDAVQFTDTRDPGAFARTLLELLADGRRRDALARAARARAATFTAERMAGQTLDCYRAALSAAGG
jgi:glycosyltransferase involved in cell wall biosynthesis